MATYAIGDIQGCFTELELLLEKISFQPGRDRLWFVGDLVNRGPDSLACLRRIHELDEHSVVVLGNHDLHLMAAAVDHHELIPGKDTMQDILAAPDQSRLLEWLRHRPLLHYDEDLGYVMTHAGIPAAWDLPLARSLAAEVEDILRSPRYKRLLKEMYGDTPAQWSPKLRGWERARFILNALTRMRYCTPEGHLDFRDNGPPSTEHEGLLPWYQLQGLRSQSMPVIFGHWSTLMLEKDSFSAHRFSDYKVIPLDTGCVWGGYLTAMRLEDRRYFSVPSTRSSTVNRIS